MSPATGKDVVAPLPGELVGIIESGAMKGPNSAAMGGAAPGAQQPPVNPEDDRNRIVLDVARVNMLYTVSDRGRFVTDSRQDDFQIIEGNKLQKVLEFAKEATCRCGWAFWWTPPTVFATGSGSSRSRRLSSSAR